MAEEDEIALLHQIQAAVGQENLEWGDGTEAGGNMGGTFTENSDQLVKDEKVTDDQVLRALSPSAAPSDGGEYTPRSPSNIATQAAKQVDSRASSAASVKRPRTIGGFLADDSDDEDEIKISTSKPSSHLQLPTGAPVRSTSRSPLHLESTPQDQSRAQSQGVSSATPAGNTPLNASASQPHAESSNVSNLPKARLPHDTVGILEDRIKEDPRGDLEAWLSLISEHRKRNKLDDARAVYERFFKVFPSAVGVLCSLLAGLTDNDRLIFGSHMLRWNLALTTFSVLNRFLESLFSRCQMSASGPFISTIFDVEMILRMMSMELHVKLSPSHMTSSWPILALIENPAKYGRSISSLFGLLLA
jgi:cleavage stimulation factor subunit 3